MKEKQYDEGKKKAHPRSALRNDIASAHFRFQATFRKSFKPKEK